MRTTTREFKVVAGFGTVGACLQAIRSGLREQSIACKQATTEEHDSKLCTISCWATNPAMGFTLVELMAAIGLIIALTAGISLAFRREGNSGVALRAAQREIGSALRLAQRTAGARQVPVRLGVLAQPAPAADPGGAGRQWWLLGAEGPAWVRLREGGELPPGTRLVPSERSGLRLRTGVTWPEELLSQFEAPLAWEDGAMEYLEFRPDGSVAGGPRRIVVAVADEAPGQAPRLVDPAAIRAVRITADGRIEEADR